jgi:hypothetical protein
LPVVDPDRRAADMPGTTGSEKQHCFVNIVGAARSSMGMRDFAFRPGPQGELCAAPPQMALSRPLLKDIHVLVFSHARV